MLSFWYKVSYYFSLIFSQYFFPPVNKMHKCQWLLSLSIPFTLAIQFNDINKRLICSNQMTFYFLYQRKTKCLFRNGIEVKPEASNWAFIAETIEATISNKKQSGRKLLFQNEIHKLLLCNMIHFTTIAYFFFHKQILCGIENVFLQTGKDFFLLRASYDEIERGC